MWDRVIGCLVTLMLSLLAVPLAAPAQQAAKIPRVGVLRPGNPPPGGFGQQEAFESGLRDLGWTPGTSLLIEYRYAEGKPERLPELAAELVRLQVDVIVASAPPGVRAAQQATRTIPIVMAATADPVGLGFVTSLAHPGGTSWD
jgi:putative tryptophan/tyrosine transport system substrate-binding protein